MQQFLEVMVIVPTALVLLSGLLLALGMIAMGAAADVEAVKVTKRIRIRNADHT